MKPAEDIRAFAEICARLDDPFAARDSVLRAVGLSTAEWARIQDTWRQRLSAGSEAAELGRAFGEAYAAGKSLGPGARTDAELEGRPGIDEAPVPAAVPAVAAVDGPSPLEPAMVDPGPAVPTFLKEPAPESAVATMPAPNPRFRPVTADFALPLKEPLPFNPGAPSSLPEPEAKPPEPKAFSGGTGDVDVTAIMRQIVPFGPEHAHAPSTAALPPIAAPAQQAPLPPPAGSSIRVAAQPAAGPVGPRTGSGAPDLTLDQYASLCAAIAVFPQHADTIFQQYGITSRRDRPSVDRMWRERLRRDPSLYRDWTELYQRYQEYWAQKTRHGSRG